VKAAIHVPLNTQHGRYPRLQVNKHGEVVLVIENRGLLSTEILVGKLPGSKSTVPLGKRFDDWEVAGELTDYDGEVTISLKNEQ